VPKLRVLILEDEPLIALELEQIVLGLSAADIIVKASVAEARDALREPLDFAFLDVNVTDGHTYEVAHHLTEKFVPFVFVSASPPNQLPSELLHVRFIVKPFRRSQIERELGVFER
jgi:DNA-binding LytR/AlgR family response regulator